MARMMPVRVIKSYIFAELVNHDGEYMRMLYELTDSELTFEAIEPEFRMDSVYYNLKNTETNIILEGTMVQGKVWTGKFPGEDQTEIEPERKELEI